jgi:TetR/AcrR family transcriptional repressor of mexJK operon
VKDWAADHPKAKLMARKRAQILAAAREAFLRLGYEGSSMEAIAAAADVSIMTLYRHAESKDDLFAAVIASACDPSDEAEQAEFMRLMSKPLGDIFTSLGMISQQRLADPATVSLMRVVMAETARFPELGDIAYRGFVGHLETMVSEVLGRLPQTQTLSKATRRRLGERFIDRLFGADMLRILLGLKGLTPHEQKQRSERARDDILGADEIELAADEGRRTG